MIPECFVWIDRAQYQPEISEKEQQEIAIDLGQ